MTWIAVALGGAFGAVLRYALSLWLSPKTGAFPWSTFLANVLGSLLMGVLFVLIVEKQLLPAAWRPWLMVGLLGAFTTFSTFSLELLGLWQLGKTAIAALYLVASVAGCLLAVGIGYYLAAKFIH